MMGLGHPKLLAHIDGILKPMRASKDSWNEFKGYVAKFYPMVETTELGLEIELNEK